MTFVKNLWGDLVAKRLWPVAVALLVALVAVPVLLGSSGAAGDVTPTGATGSTGADGAAGLHAEVALVPSLPERRDRAGKERDPFKQRAQTGGPTGVTGATGATGASSASPSAAGGAASSAGSSDATPSGATPDATKPSATPKKPTTADPLDAFVVTLRLGTSKAAKRDTTDVEHLTPLPSADSPFFVYLGVLSDEKTAVFLLSSDVKASGDGACKPRISDCETVELRKGDTELFDVTADDGKVTQYRLDVVRVAKQDTKATPNDAVAAKATSRTVKASGDAGKAAASASGAQSTDDLGSDQYKVDEKTGLLRRVRSSGSGLGAHLRPESGATGRAGSLAQAAPRAAAAKGTAAARFLPAR